MSAIAQQIADQASGALGDPDGMIRIPGGTFRMGSDRHDPEGPAHPVTVGGFWMGRHLVTNRQFKEFVSAKHITVAEMIPDLKDYPGSR